MYSVLYYRNDANVSDLREFRDLNEFNEWLDVQRKVLKERIDIVGITYEEDRKMKK